MPCTSNMPPSFDRISVKTLPLRPMPAPQPGMDRVYVGMHEVCCTERIDDDLIAQEAMKHHLAAQAAMNLRKIRQEAPGQWAAAAVGITWLVVSLAALLAVNAAYLWP